MPRVVPALAAGLAPGQHVTPMSIALVVTTGLAGAAATIRRWNRPDGGI